MLYRTVYDLLLNNLFFVSERITRIDRSILDFCILDETVVKAVVRRSVSILRVVLEVKADRNMSIMDHDTREDRFLLNLLRLDH